MTTKSLVGTYDAPRSSLHTLLVEAEIIGYEVVPCLDTRCQQVWVDARYDDNFLVALDELLYAAVR
jgi:hypothetical protein